MSLVTRTLRVMEETLSRREDEVSLLESIVTCLTSFVLLLEDVRTVQYTYNVCIYIWLLFECSYVEIEYVLEEPTHTNTINRGIYSKFTISVHSLCGKCPSTSAFCNAMKGIHPKDCCMVDLVSGTTYEW